VQLNKNLHHYRIFTSKQKFTIYSTAKVLRNKSKHRLNPSLTSTTINQLAIRTMDCNEQFSTAKTVKMQMKPLI